MDRENYSKTQEACKQQFEHNRTFQEAQDIIEEKGLDGFATQAAKSMDRRKFLGTMGFVTAGVSVVGGMATKALADHAEIKDWDKANAKYKGAYAAIHMGGFWTITGAKTLQHYGSLTGFDIEVFDCKADVAKQREQIDLMASKSKEYDVVFLHPNAIGAFTEPVKKLIADGVVVVDIDTLLVPDLSSLDILTYTEPDNVFMSTSVTEYLCKKINYKGNIVMTQGSLTHTGCQGRAKGFRQVVSQYPDIHVIDETPAEWSADKARQIWDDLLVKYDKIDAGYCHTDDMALGAYAALQAVGREKECVLGGTDGQAPGLRQLLNGKIAATGINPSGRVHGFGFWAAWFHIVNQVPKSDIPRFIRTDAPAVTLDSPRDEVESYIWANEHYIL